MQNQVTVVIGKKGSGKSTLVREIVAERKRVAVIDSLAEYDESDGCRVVYEDECVDAMIDAAQSKTFRLSLRRLEIEDNLDLLRLAYEIEDYLLVVEETSLYVTASVLPSEVAQLIRYGRHKRIDQCYVARRPSELHRDLTANADNIVCFQTQEPRDLVYLRNYFGDEAFELRDLEGYRIKVFGNLEKAPKAVLHRLANQ